MRITVIAVGKLRDRATGELIKKYSARLPRGVKIKWIEVPAESGKRDAKTALEKEAEKIRARIPERARTAALSEKGREMSSMEFAKWLGKVRDAGRDLCFIIGSADGLDPDLIKEADDAVSLSRLTFPHELVRAVLAEQIYRAFSILRGEPYHRE
jgi:23S rRNA (pseudouridine1915-N3)-methyltransferase